MNKYGAPRSIIFLFLLVWSWLNVAQLYVQVNKKKEPFIPNVSCPKAPFTSANKNIEITQLSDTFIFLIEVFSEQIAEEDLIEKEQDVLRYLCFYYKFCLAVLSQHQQIQFSEVLFTFKSILQPPLFLLHHSFKDF